MAHRRTQIRDAAVVLIKGVAGVTVTKSRLHNWQTDQLPGVAVYTLTEPVDTVNLGRTQERTLTLAIDIQAREIVEVDGDIDTVLDDWCVLVEKALAADWQFGGLAQTSFLVNTTIGLTGEGEARHGIARLEYEIAYRTTPAAPDG